MSVIVKGMTMPENCAMCERWSICECLKEYKDYESILYAVDDGDLVRADECPLVEIPTSHGRLIDATFEENHYASMLLNPTPDVTVEDRKKAKAIIDALHMARTVIEAEGETK